MPPSEVDKPGHTGAASASGHESRQSRGSMPNCAEKDFAKCDKLA